MPWKKCPHCDGFSYSSISKPDQWSCPYCNRDITSTPVEIEPPKQIETYRHTL